MNAQYRAKSYHRGRPPTAVLTRARFRTACSRLS
jgi:hypothetical protein